MLRQIVAFLAVAVSVAFATTCGFCYPGYGGYENSVPLLNVGTYNNGFYGSGVLNAGYASPAISTFSAVGDAEVISSCENSAVSPLASTGIFSSGRYGSGYGFGGCPRSFVATAC